MIRRFRTFLVLGTAAACGPALEWEGDYDPGDIVFEHAIAARQAEETADGIPVEQLSVILSNDQNLCAALAGTPNGLLTELDDVMAVQAVGIKAGEFTEYDTNVGIVKALLSPEDGESAVAVAFVERSGGTTIADIGTDNRLDAEAVSDAQINVNSQSLSSGEIRRISGSIRADLTLDQTDPETFDVDIDDDDDPDYRRINATVRARFSGAVGCSSLGD